MSAQPTDEAPLASFEFRRGELAGSHLSLFSSRLVHRGSEFSETMPLDRMGAVGIGFERDHGRIVWGSVLLAVALAAFAASWPLRMLVTTALGEVAAQPPGGGFLPAALRALDFCVAVLPFASVAIALWATAWVVLGWIGDTVLTVVIAPAERVYAARGRDPALVEFAEAVAARVAECRR
ncbi:MAG: hypothetical protein JSS40_06750 [Proteobacteria bacterium]|nr:hypothetical protein [Pseudomonadota bacterium]